jgi:PQQ-dependent dehydrogenase (methanol/ethanol family)
MLVCSALLAAAFATRVAANDAIPASADPALMRHSVLAEINTASVGRLHGIDSGSGNAVHADGPAIDIEDAGGRPLRLLINAAAAAVQALDISDADHPQQVWSYPYQSKAGHDSAVPLLCCDLPHRTLSYAHGKVVFATPDGSILALDAHTGKAVWMVEQQYPESGALMPAPIIAGDKVIAGLGAGKFATQPRLVAFALDSGRLDWSCQSVGTDAQQCVTPRTRSANPQAEDSDSHLRSPTAAGISWVWYSYDPKLRVLYALRQDNASMTMFAHDIDTGALHWVYQMPPFEPTQDAGLNENILLDMSVDGAVHKCLVHFDRNGIAYVFDRADGTLLRAHQFNSAGAAPAQYAPHSRPPRHTHPLACPAGIAGSDQQPCAVDAAQPSKFYCPINNWCRADTPRDDSDARQAVVYVYSNVYLYPHSPDDAGVLEKFDVLTGNSDWQLADAFPNWGGALLTDGGLVFYASLSGDFRAVDRETGKILWQQKLADGITGDPITYQIKGRQYISIRSGVGRWLRVPTAAGFDLSDKYGAAGATAMAKAEALNHISQDGVLHTFRLEH